MRTKTIGVRELRTDFAKIAKAAKQGTSFLVTLHNQPLFRIEPLKKNTFRLKDLLEIRFHDEDRNLSKKIDKIVYDL